MKKDITDELVDAVTRLINKLDTHKGKCDNLVNVCDKCGQSILYCNEHRAALQRRVRRVREALENFKKEI